MSDHLFITRFTLNTLLDIINNNCSNLSILATIILLQWDTWHVRMVQEWWDHHVATARVSWTMLIVTRRSACPPSRLTVTRRRWLGAWWSSTMMSVTTWWRQCAPRPRTSRTWRCAPGPWPWSTLSPRRGWWRGCGRRSVMMWRSVSPLLSQVTGTMLQVAERLWGESVTRCQLWSPSPDLCHSSFLNLGRPASSNKFCFRELNVSRWAALHEWRHLVEFNNQTEPEHDDDDDDNDDDIIVGEREKMHVVTPGEARTTSQDWQVQRGAGRGRVQWSDSSAAETEVSIQDHQLLVTECADYETVEEHKNIVLVNTKHFDSLKLSIHDRPCIEL